MEDFPTRTYGTSGLDNRPLFGETSAKDRIINLVVGSLTSLLILDFVTCHGTLTRASTRPPKLNYVFLKCPNERRRRQSEKRYTKINQDTRKANKQIQSEKGSSSDGHIS
ncbi:transmembrane protein 243 isoform 4-T4 [Callospermophilus lateralis]